MLLTVKKQIEETVEVKTGTYYKDFIGNLHHINDEGQLITVRQTMISIWEPGHGNSYTEKVQELLSSGKPSTKDEFDKAYCETIDKLNRAAMAEVI